jgi:putative acetyltransferase
MLFVDPAHARRGVATTLLDALIRLARSRGAKTVTSEVSDTAKPLFEGMGFESQRRNLNIVGDEWLGNTTMSKSLDAETAPPPTRH